MVSINNIFNRFKNKNNEDAKQIKMNISDLIYCVTQFEQQLNAEEYCKLFLESLSNLEPNAEVTDELLEQFKTVIKEFVEYDFYKNELCYPSTEFQVQSNLYNKYRTARKEDDGSYSICPVITNDKLIKFMHQFFLEQPDNSLIEALKESNNQSYDTLLHAKINTYYGKLPIIKSRTKAIVDAIEMIRYNYELSPSDFQFLEIKLVEALEIQQKINEIGNVVVRKTVYDELITNMTADEYFEIVIPAFQTLLKIEQDLVFISQKIWENYFETRGAKFVHALTAGVVESDKMPKICTSLYLDDLATIPYGHIGYEYGVSMENIDCISECDIGSWHLNKQDFLRYSIMHSMQWNEETNMFYEDGYYSKLLPPDYIEFKARENNVNQEKINYTEILLINRPKKIRPLKAFYTDLATPLEIAQISEIAKKQGLDVEFIDTKSIKQTMNAKGL